jgi:glycerophosphoryl diester phosphodiesterase
MLAFAGIVETTSGQFIVAHRGASFDAPENTLSAFRLAWEQGADAIEGDFYLTKDQKIVCIHDKNTKRVSPNHPDTLVANATLEELQALDVGAWKDPKFQDERMPSLQQVLAIVPEGKRFFVEIKCGPEILPALKECLEQSKIKPEQIVIIAFDAAVIQGARRLMPQYKANWLAGFKNNNPRKEWTPTFTEIFEKLKKTEATGMGIQANREVVDSSAAKSILDAGLEFHVWTVNSVDDARYFSSLGVHSITTDKPAIIRQAIQGLR